MKTAVRLSLFVVVGFLLLCGFTVLAQDHVAQQPTGTSVPNLIRYGGILKDADGAVLASQTVGVTFSIYKQADGGVSLWHEVRNVTTDAAGQYNVLLGSTMTEGVPVELFSDQEQRWLNVEVQGQQGQPRVLMVSVPYAFKAHEAETLGGLPASAFVKVPPTDATGSTGAVTGTAVNALSATGKANISSKGKSAAFRNNTICAGLTANASANFIPLFDSTVCNLVNSTIYQVGSNVGIGTQIPSTALEVNGAITADQWYDITTAESPFLSIGWPGVISSNQNTWLGLFAGGQGSNASDSGVNNTFVGYNAAALNRTGGGNTALGAQAGFRNLNGNFNTFIGQGAGLNNRNGSDNTITGFRAGANNTADANSFYGSQSGQSNTSGVQNTFLGYKTGVTNSVGISNVFVGYNVGQANVTESFNTFVGANTGFNSNAGGNTFLGYSAGSSTNSGSGNTATGYNAGRSNTTGVNNAYYGLNADFNANDAVTTGDRNTYLGAAAGSSFVIGSTLSRSNNTFIGFGAGSAGNSNGVITGQNNIFLGVDAGTLELDVSNNIEIGNTGPAPEVGKILTSCVDPKKPCSNQILIGTLGTHKDTYIQGIYYALEPAAYPSKVVCVAPDGKLWGGKTYDDHCNIIVGTRHFEDHIADMGDSSSKLFQLRPVTFSYKAPYDDGSHALQYGLVAEEVASIDPNMVIYDKNGQPYSVKYQMLAPMLLNELQKQHAVVEVQQDVIKTQQGQIQTQGQQIADLQQRLSRLESFIGAKK